MVGVIVLAAIGLWVFVCVLALGMCREAKAGDQAMEIACGRYRNRHIDWTVADQRQPDPAVDHPASLIGMACTGDEAGVVGGS
jgi:hypothetical protein